MQDCWKDCNFTFTWNDHVIITTEHPWALFERHCPCFTYVWAPDQSSQQNSIYQEEPLYHKAVPELKLDQIIRWNLDRTVLDTCSQLQMCIILGTTTPFYTGNEHKDVTLCSEAAMKQEKYLIDRSFKDRTPSHHVSFYLRLHEYRKCSIWNSGVLKAIIWPLVQ